MIKNKLNQLSRQKICESIHITTRTLNNWENDKHIENIMKYIKLLQILNIDPFEQLTEYEKKKHQTP